MLQCPQKSLYFISISIINFCLLQMSKKMIRQINTIFFVVSDISSFIITKATRIPAEDITRHFHLNITLKKRMYQRLNEWFSFIK